MDGPAGVPPPRSRDQRADHLLAGPLGRELLCEFLGLGVVHRLFETLGLGPVPGTAMFRPIGSPPETGRTGRPPRAWTEVEAHEVQDAVSTIVAERHWSRLHSIDRLELLTELADVSSGFGFGGGDEALWGLTGLARDALRPVALALVDAPATSRWWEPVYRPDQRLLEWDDVPAFVGPGFDEGIRRAMAEERQENEEARKLAATRRRPERMGASWWSAPSFASSSWTTGPCADVPTIALGHFIDTYSPFSDTGATVWSSEMRPEARVLEILTASDWRDLVERHPRDVRGTHDGEWRYWGGVEGPWRLPDWERVRETFDGVHVTIGGYVSACGRALPVSDGFTMLAGWIPGATLWLRDVAITRQRRGRWYGNPRALQGWNDVRSRWHPDEQLT